MNKKMMHSIGSVLLMGCLSETFISGIKFLMIRKKNTYKLFKCLLIPWHNYTRNLNLVCAVKHHVPILCVKLVTTKYS